MDMVLQLYMPTEQESPINQVTEVSMKHLKGTNDYNLYYTFKYRANTIMIF